MFSTKITTIRAIIYLGVVLLVAAVMMCDAQNDMYGRMSRKRFCGSILTSTLQILCEDGYNEMQKKSSYDTEFVYGDQPTVEELPIQVPGYPFMSRMSGTEMKPRTRRFRRGVYDECCKKSCSINELRSYCNTNNNQ